MLAVATGWTPDVLADLPLDFRSACHWTLYVKALVGDEGLPDLTVPQGASPAQRLEIGKARAAQARLRKVLYPDG